MTDIKDEVKAFFAEFLEAYSKENIELFNSFFQKDENLVVFGAFDKWIGWKEYKDAATKEKEQFDTIAMKCKWQSIEGEGNVAWIAAQVEISITMPDRQFTVPARLTTIVNKINGEWKIVQQHISIKAQ